MNVFYRKLKLHFRSRSAWTTSISFNVRKPQSVKRGIVIKNKINLSLSEREQCSMDLEYLHGPFCAPFSASFYEYRRFVEQTVVSTI